MHNISVLVLEDHSFQRSLAIFVLQQLGIQQIYSAADGEEALKLLKQTGPIDIVLCDLKMPGMDGLAFLRHASQKKLIKAVILCSEINPELHRAVLQVVAFLDVRLLADLGKPLQLRPLKKAFSLYLSPPCISMSPNLPHSPKKISEASINAAISNGEFQAYFQPKFQLQDETLYGAEVLVRWLHPQYGLIGPDDFLWAVESFGLLDDMILSLLEQGLTIQSQLLKQGYPIIELAFNLHPSQLSSLTLTEHIRAMLTKHQRTPSSITFEITEVGLLETPEIGLENLIRLRMMGCALAIDDFGVGYSSLQRLAELPFNQIKLDASFVRNYKKHPRCKDVIFSTLALAKSLDMQVIIEGIETEQERQELLQLGGTYAQGYWYAKPMPHYLFIDWLNNTNAPAKRTTAQAL